MNARPLDIFLKTLKKDAFFNIFFNFCKVSIFETFRRFNTIFVYKYDLKMITH